MSQNDGAGEEESLLHAGKRKISSAWDSFSDFALKDGVLEVAVGLIIAAAFTALVQSLVSDILTPLLSLLPFLQRNLPEKFAVLRRGDDYRHGGPRYETVKQALKDGAVVLAYGKFIDKILNFFVIGITLYLIAWGYQLVSGDKVIKETTRCKACRKYISVKAKRCVNCTSWQDGRDA